MELKIFDNNGNLTNEKVEFDDSIFFKKSYEKSLHLEIKRYLFAQRQGTHKSKERGEVSGSTRKLHRQKGTGNSRKGSIKNPIFRGGGRVFGPRPRKYYIKVNKTTKSIIRKFIIEKKILQNKVKIVDDISSLKIPKTKLVLKLLDSLNLIGKKSLIITGKYDKILYLSFRNLKMYKFIHVNELDCFSLLNYPYVILLKNSIEKIKNFLIISKYYDN
ncbi:50S ribosomal protein L4 [Blattabacterium cuenoti]|uniref:50S ribosomal protein L4 n=1 Tax=Blattabacterium cuenoti TaxID=1653831 RepID=UPI00163C5072|nr:50S ribosomal protein L4 [Blattabacterium cuenoti]